MIRRVIFFLFIAGSAYVLWNLQRGDPQPSPVVYEALPELRDDAPALINAPGTQSAIGGASAPAPVATTAGAQDDISPESADDYTCTIASTRAVTAASPTRVYEWTDENGNRHFGDSPPRGVDARLVDSGQPARPDYFNLSIDFRGRMGVGFFQDRLRANVTKIYQVLADLLGNDRLRQVDLNVLIFPDQSSFQDYARQNAGELVASSAGGFYTNMTNEAVTYQYADDEETLAVARHEAVHVLLNGMLGAGPLWLHEGMAEYFEQMTMSEQYARIAPNMDWMYLASESVENGYPQRLGDFLILDEEGWNEGGLGKREIKYALGWSLVYFLMQSSQGKQTLGALLQRIADDFCAPTNSANVLATNYPGGLNALQAAFYSWLADPEAIRAQTL